MKNMKDVKLHTKQERQSYIQNKKDIKLDTKQERK